jgi:outer membrane protein TolC
MTKHSMSTGLFAALLAAAGVIGPARAMGQSVSDTVPLVTLSEARRRAATVAPTIVAARGDVSTAIWERRAAVSDLLTPGVNAGMSYIRFSDPFFNFGTGRITPNATSATLQANYTLLGGGKLGNLRRSRASVESAEANETATRFRAAMATDAAYFAVLADRELSRVAADGLKRALEAFGVARARVLAGDAIATDSLQLLLQVTRARFTLLQRDSALAISRLRLGRQVGLPGPAEAVIDSTPTPDLPFTRAEAIAEMRARGPEVEAARAAERRAHAAVVAERESYLPDIIIGATAGAYDAEFFPAAFKRSQLAVTLSLPVWDSGQRELAMSRARAERNTAAAERKDRERGAAETMAAAYHGYETSRAGIELAQIGVSAATESYRVQSARYAEGATTILDLLESQGALTEAEATLVQAHYATRLALAQIEALLGRRIVDKQDRGPRDRGGER